MLIAAFKKDLKYPSDTKNRIEGYEKILKMIAFHLNEGN